MMRRPILLHYTIAVVLAFAALSPLRAQISFQFNYLDTAGTGFNDTIAGAQRRAELEAASNYLGGYFLTSQPITITYNVTSLTDPMSGILASAGSPLTTGAPGFHQSVVQHKIITGEDANGATADGTINYNFGRNWGYGDSVGSDEFDFWTVAMHEGLHAFGFLTYLGGDGTGGHGRPSGESDAWADFDRYLTNSDGVALVDPNTFGYNTSLGLSPITTGLFFSGPNAMAAYQGHAVPLFTSDPWTGSTGSHLDDNTFTNPDLSALNALKIMNAYVDAGPGVRTLSNLELGILKDLGYTVVPEPATWLLLMGGFALVFWRRRVFPARG